MSYGRQSTPTNFIPTSTCPLHLSTWNHILVSRSATPAATALRWKEWKKQHGGQPHIKIMSIQVRAPLRTCIDHFQYRTPPRYKDLKYPEWRGIAGIFLQTPAITNRHLNRQKSYVLTEKTARLINIGEIYWSNEVRGREAEEWLMGARMEWMRGMKTGSWRHESCRLPVTVHTGLPVTVILLSVPQNR